MIRNSNKKRLAIGIVGFAIVMGTIVVYRGTVDRPDFVLPLPNLEVSLDWYTHRISNTNIILTRSETLPDIGATEGYAYGDQIMISVAPFDGDLMRPEDWDQLTWTDDEVLVREKTWTHIAGIIALRLWHEAGGASGTQLTYYLFTNDRIYTLSRYPAEDVSERGIFDRFVYRYAGQMVRVDNSALQ